MTDDPDQFAGRDARFLHCFQTRVDGFNPGGFFESDVGWNWTPGTPKFPKGVQATVGDQFNAPPKLFNVRKPKHLCNPVSKNGETMKNPDAHLVCYQVKGAKGQPKHTRRNVFLHNQFDAETGTTVKESELCVPSVSTP